MPRKPADDLDLEEGFDIEMEAEPAKPVKKRRRTKKKSEWEQVCARLEEHCDKTWICLPITLPEAYGGRVVLEIKEIRECTSEFFFSWLCEMWPPAKRMAHAAADYDDIRTRMEAFMNIVNFHRVMEMPKVTM